MTKKTKKPRTPAHTNAALVGAAFGIVERADAAAGRYRNETEMDLSQLQAAAEYRSDPDARDRAKAEIMRRRQAEHAQLLTRAAIDYSDATDDSLRMLAKHAKEDRVRDAAKAEIARREAIAGAYDAELLRIAQVHIGSKVETLEARNSDRLDFFDCPVLGLRDALRAAYEAGRKSPRPLGRSRG